MALSLLGLAATSCGTFPWKSGRASATGAPAFRIVLGPATTATEASAFARFYPSVTPLLSNDLSTGTNGDGSVWVINLISWNLGVPQTMAPLDEVFKTMNFDLNTLLPTSRSVFTYNGSLYAVPIGVQPTGVLYRPDAFAACGLQEPSANWTIDDFLRACAVIKQTIQAGRLAGYIAPLPPLVGATSFVDATGRARTWYGEYLVDNLWSGLISGFGGTLTSNGQYAFTDSSGVRALNLAVEIAREYGAPLNRAPHSQAELGTYRSAAAMQFATYFPQGSVPGWKWARFPVLPVTPIIPVSVTGVTLSYAKGGMVHLDTNVTAPPEAQKAAVAYALWRYKLAEDSAPADPALLPPVLTDAKVQTRYWNAAARVDNGATNLGEWQDYQVMEQGWPYTGATPQTDANSLMFKALTDVVLNGADLVSTIGTVVNHLNVEVARAKT